MRGRDQRRAQRRFGRGRRRAPNNRQVMAALAEGRRGNLTDELAGLRLLFDNRFAKHVFLIRHSIEEYREASRELWLRR